MRKDRTFSAVLALGLCGLLAAFAGCSGSVQNSAGCDVDGKHHAVGDTFPASDGCNHCSCGERGEVQCTLLGCVPAPPEPDAGSSCDALVSELKDTLASVQRCQSAADCGQRIPGSSCGCTHDLIARKDADLSSYLAQRAKGSELGCATEGASDCDCPNADGFACIDQTCAWNYVNVDPVPVCEIYDPAELCVRGTPTADGELIATGDSLQITVRSSGCLSSSCSKVVEASCTIGSGVAFDVTANFCVANNTDPGRACTDDCGIAHADCSFGQPLTAGEHQVKLGSIAVGFQVPSKLPLGGLCASTR